MRSITRQERGTERTATISRLTDEHKKLTRELTNNDEEATVIRGKLESMQSVQSMQSEQAEQSERLEQSRDPGNNPKQLKYRFSKAPEEIEQRKLEARLKELAREQARLEVKADRLLVKKSRREAKEAQVKRVKEQSRIHSWKPASP